MSATSVAVSRRIADVEMMDTMQWTNTTGVDVVNNQLIPIAGQAANMGIVVIAAQAIAAGATGTVIRKMVVELPAAASVFSQGYTVQYVPSATSVSVGGTAAGTYAVGLCVEDAGTAAGYVKVALNEGPKAFYVW
jgi:predicted RecA/RadA family phage recombinase